MTAGRYTYSPAPEPQQRRQRNPWVALLLWLFGVGLGAVLAVFAIAAGLRFGAYLAEHEIRTNVQAPASACRQLLSARQ